MRCNKVNNAQKSITKKQHYLPKAYLHFFAHQERTTKKIYTYYCKEKIVRYVSVNDICHRPFLYEQKYQSLTESTEYILAPNEIENDFIDVEGEYVTLVDALIRGVHEKNTIILKDNEINKIANFMSSLSIRHPLIVHVINSVSKINFRENFSDLEELQKLFPDVHESFFEAVFAQENLNRCLKVFTQSLAKTTNNSKMVILKAFSSSFITSDMPVVNIYGVSNNVEYDLLGFPISSDLFLAFVDTDIELQSIITVNDEIVNKINSNQLRKSTRYIFSQSKNFSDILESAKEIALSDDNSENPPYIYNEEAKKLYDKIMSNYKY